ncbi:MAG: chromate efflux transporter [Bacillota bacterium]
MKGSSRRAALAEVAALFARLGVTGFGGPAAHIAMMREEVVHRRRWVTDQRFLDLLGLTNLIPGPNSTEMAIHLGYLRAGWPGLIVAGASFILPAALIVSAFAWAYVAYGATPQATWLLYGVKPVIIAVVVHALAGMVRTALRSPLAMAWGALVLGLYWLGVNEILLLFGAGLLFAVLRQGMFRVRPGPSLPAVVGTAAAAAATTVAGNAAPFSLSLIFWVFLKVGSVLYGSGYVLLAFLRNDFVQRLGWLTDRQLLDAISVGQFTPGPVFTTATFIGYLLGRWPGAVLATLGIFLPSFIFVAAVHPLGARLRRSPWTSAALDGVNIAALGLMAGVTLQLARSALVDGFTSALALVSLAALVRYRVNSAWLVLAGASAGLAAELLVA